MCRLEANALAWNGPVFVSSHCHLVLTCSHATLALRKESFIVLFSPQLFKLRNVNNTSCSSCLCIKIIEIYSSIEAIKTLDVGAHCNFIFILQNVNMDEEEEDEEEDEKEEACINQS